jgi:hypothetical protein
MTPEQEEEFNHFAHDDAAKIIDPDAFQKWEQGDQFERMQVINRMIAAREKAKAIAALSIPPQTKKRGKLPPIGDELYEHYPAMSAQTHADLVKDYAREAVRAAISDVTNHGCKSDLHPEYVTKQDGTKSGYKSDLHPGNVPSEGGE